MTDPELCDGCMAGRAWCVCPVAPVDPAPSEAPTPFVVVARRVKIGAEIWRAVCAEIARDDTAGHDPGDEHDGGTP